MIQRFGLIALAATLLVVAPLFGGLAEGAASGKVIGMTSGGGNKGYGVADFAPGLGGKRQHQTMTITTPISNMQLVDTIGGSGAYGTNTGGQLTATFTDHSDSCLSFTTTSTTWIGSGKVVFGGTTGSTHTINFKNYHMVFLRGASYANESSSAAGDGVQNGNETGIDSFYAPTGFSCAAGALTKLSVVGVMKITAP